ncbi:shikimate dehydrogenase [Desulfoplanes sp.]
MEIYGILGHPAGHSLSPTIHNWGFTARGLAKTYHFFDIAPDNLATFMTCVRTLPIHGLSVTIPHKETILPFMDTLTDTARAIGAVNTVVRTQDGRLLGDNTDVTGFLAPLIGQAIRPKTALVLGAGGAARAVLYGLAQLGTATVVTCRNAGTGSRLAREMEASFVDWNDRSGVQAELLVNTTPLGMRGKFLEASPWPFSFSNCRVCYDLIYTPRMTTFLSQARNGGRTVISGLDMFVHQAAAQFKRWTQQPLPLPGAALLVASRLAPPPEAQNGPVGQTMGPA